MHAVRLLLMSASTQATCRRQSRKSAAESEAASAAWHNAAQGPGRACRSSRELVHALALAGSAIGEELGPPFKRGIGGPAGWMILDEPELHLGEHIVVPDLGGWRRERLPEVPLAPYLELGDAAVRLKPFDAIEIPLGALWQR